MEIIFKINNNYNKSQNQYRFKIQNNLDRILNALKRRN